MSHKLPVLLFSTKRLAVAFTIVVALIVASVSIASAEHDHSDTKEHPTVMTYSKLVGIRPFPDWDAPIQTTVWAGVELQAIARGHYDWLYVSSGFGSGWIPRSAVIATFDVSILPLWKPTKADSLIGNYTLTSNQSRMIAGVPEDEIYRGDPQLDAFRPTGSVRTERAAIFTGPGHQYNVIGQLQQRDRPTLHAVDATRQFVFVWTNSVDGWVLASNLQTSVDLLTLPIWNRPMHSAQSATTGRVDVANLNLRTGPDLDNRILSTLSQGERVTVISQNESGTWVQIATADGVGWSYAPMIRFDSSR